MVNFGKRILSSAHKPWEEYYIDYNLLKRKLFLKRREEYERQQQQNQKPKEKEEQVVETKASSLSTPNEHPKLPSVSSFSSLGRTMSGSLLSFAIGSGTAPNPEDTPRVDIFRMSLEEEIEQCVLFFLQIQGDIAEELTKLRKRQKLWKDTTTYQPCYYANETEIKDVAKLYQEIGLKLLRLIKFTELNITAINKIIKKHDKHFLNEQLCDHYLSVDAMFPTTTNKKKKKKKNPILVSKNTSTTINRIQQQQQQQQQTEDTPLEQFYHFGGISALVCTLRNGLLDVAEADKHLWEVDHGLEIAEQQLYGGGRGGGTSSFSSDTDPTNAADGTTPIQFPFQDACLEVEPILDSLERARARLKQASQYEQKLATVSLMFFQDQEDDTGDDENGSDGDTSLLVLPDPYPQEISTISRNLNLISAFLYMTNYYIVAPNCGHYAALLGGSEADTAIIIGMTPLASQFGAVLYSWWANQSYKHPLLFASACSSLGNLFYAAALPLKSIKLIFIGRLLNGFGGARAINRRYIADGYSNEERTAASATFITGSSLGMSAGPFINAMICLVMTDNDQGEFLTSSTAPGYVMAFAWFLFLLLTLFFFQEPEILVKRKLQEEKRKEKKQQQQQQKLETSMDETKPLLGVMDSSKNAVKTTTATPKAFNILSSMWSNIPVVTTLLVYFVLKGVIECLMSSTSMVTTHHFDWPSSTVGLYMSILGLLMFPTNLLVARYSRWYLDRDLILFFLLVTLVGILCVVNYYGTTYTITQYITGSIIIFCAANSLEGVNLSLLSKTIPKSWARHGILNSGLLATEFGTFGRTVTATFLTGIARNYGIDGLLNRSFLPVGLFVVVTIAVVWKTFDRLVPIDDDDDDDEDD